MSNPNSRRPTYFHGNAPQPVRWTINGPDPSAQTALESEQVLNGQGNIHQANLVAHQEARERVIAIIRALHVVSEPAIESKIQVWDNLPQAADWASRSGSRLIQRLAPDNTVTATEWSFGRMRTPKETKFEVAKRTEGWVIPYALGGRPIAPKHIPKQFKEHDLIILKDPDVVEQGKLPPTYIGGMEKHDGGPREGQTFSTHIATGMTLSANERGGYFGDQAIDGLTEVGELDNVNNERQKLWRIGNAVLAHAQQLNPGGPNPIEAHLPPMPLVVYQETEFHTPVNIHPYMIPTAPAVQQRPILHNTI